MRNLVLAIADEYEEDPEAPDLEPKIVIDHEEEGHEVGSRGNSSQMRTIYVL